MKWKQFLTPVNNLDPDEARGVIDQHPAGDVTVLDVRQPAEYEVDHLPGAKLIPLSELPGRMKELDPSKPVVTY